MTRVVQLLSHSIEAFDQLRLYTRLGIEAVDIGGYIDPRQPHDEKRPALPEAPFCPELKAAIDGLGQPDNLRAAQSHIPDAFLDWLGNDGVIVMHHRLERMVEDWPRLRDWMRGAGGRRIIWRSVGQSVEYNERQMAPLRRDGLERVAYSPKEANIPGYCGHDAIIRFHKDPAEWYGWTGDNPVVLNIAQHDETPYARAEWLNWRFWEQATRDLPRVFAGPHSDKIGGLGTLPLDEMRALLRSSRVFLYTGTQPASYTLGLIESMMTGIPVVSIGPKWMTIFPYGPDLFEGHDIALWSQDSIEQTRIDLERLLNDEDDAWQLSQITRQRAIDLFGMDAIGRQWKQYLDGTKIEFSTVREAVTA